MTDPLQDPGVQGLAQLGRNAIERVAQLEHWLGNLLAVIHRDGGHYESEHGTEKACADAETAVHVLRGSLEGYVEANRHMKGELDDALEDARKYAEAQREIARLREALLGASCQVTDFWSKTLSDGNRRLQQMLLNLDPDRFSDEELQK